MTRNDSDWVKDLFTANASDWTPASVYHAVHVLYAPLSNAPEVSKRCASVLSDTELQRADRFLTADLKVQFQQRRAFRRYCGALALGSPQSLSRIVFAETDKGRPYLPDLPDCSFSFSSCRFGFLGAWSFTHTIGVDIEDQTRSLDALELARGFFSNAEANALEGVGSQARLRTFFKLWSLKEAALKSIGEGLPYGLDAFEFQLSPHLRVVHAPHDHGGAERISAHLIERANSCACLIAHSAEE